MSNLNIYLDNMTMKKLVILKKLFGCRTLDEIIDLIITFEFSSIKKQDVYNKLKIE